MKRQKIDNTDSRICIWGLVLLYFFPVHLSGQDRLSDSLRSIAMEQDIPELVIGQRIPETRLKIIQYRHGTIDLQALKRKLVILDFWNTRCGACLEAFEKFGQLQPEFGDSILILPVTYESRKTVEALLEKRARIGRKINLPSIIEDTLLRKLFPHQGDPYEVWIDPTGKIVNITDDHSVTAKNIRNLLLNNQVTVQIIQKFKSEVDISKSLIAGSNDLGNHKIIGRSIVTRHIDSLGSGWFFLTNDTMTRLLMVNQTLIDIYKYAYDVLRGKDLNGLMMDEMDKQIIIERDTYREIVHRNRINVESIEDWTQRNIFCYELFLPPGYTKQQAVKKMINDIDEVFEIRSSLEVRKIKALKLVLRFNKNTTVFKKIHEEYKDHIEAELNECVSLDKLRITFYKGKMADLVVSLNTSYDIPQVFDRTYYAGSLNIELNLKSPSLTDIKSELEKNNLDLVPFDYSSEVLVLRKRRISPIFRNANKRLD